MTHTAYLALGSNLGDREAKLAAVREHLARLPDTRVAAVSAIHETAPVGGPPGQGNYLNAAVKLETGLPPVELLHRCLQIERQLGRIRTVPNAPRTIDIDILLYDDLILNTPGLTLPHPRMHERRFVLEPLGEIAPQVIHPASGLSVAALLKALS